MRMVIPAVLAILAFAAPASAATETKTVTAQVVHSSERHPELSETCSVVTFYEWADVPGTTAASLTYVFNGQEYSESSAPPFDDTYTGAAPTRVAPPGRHRIQVGYSGAAGDGSSCDRELVPRVQALYADQGRVELTVEVDRSACNSAKRRLKARTRAVTQLKARVGEASTEEAERKLRGKLAKAKARRIRAAKGVRSAC